MSLVKRKRMESKKKVSQTKSVLTTNSFEKIHRESVNNPESFWAKLATLVSWSKPWKKVLDNGDEPFTRWYVGGEINACYNCVDRHVEAGNGDKVALIHDSPLIGVSRRITYSELQEKVSKLAGLLKRYGVEKGDRVLIYMPLIPETVMAMLATVRLGAIHSVVFGGFAATELTKRIEHAEPKVIIAASCGIEPRRVIDYISELNQAIDLSVHKPKKCIILQRKEIHIADLDPERDVDWEEGLRSAETAPCVPVEANDPLYILYTSGTTGEPKGVQRPTAGHLVALAFSMKSLYAMNSNDVWWTTSDFGWVVGHSYMCYAPLIHGITSIVYEGKPTTTPDPSSYYRIINDYKVNSIFTVPTVLRLLKEVDSEAKFGTEYDISSLRQIWVAGEHLDMSAKLWGERTFNVPVTNHWWQTETGTAISGTCLGLNNPCVDSQLTTGLPFMGYNIQVLRKDGTRSDVGELGRILVKLPLPPGTMSTLYKANERFVQTYFAKYPGYYDTLDAGFIDAQGLVYVTARADDIINVAGHRLSTLAIEDIVLSHPDVGNACVVSVPDKIKSEVPLCIFVMKEDAILNEYMIAQELVEMVREHIGPVASMRLAMSVRALPTTRSGKICRKSIADLARGKLKKIPTTVVDPTIYDDIKESLIKLGYCS